MEQRIKSLRLEELNEEAKAAYDAFLADKIMEGTVNPDTSLTAHAGVLLYNPGVFRGMNGSLLRHGGIPARDRELMMLRVAWLCQAPVPWSNHMAQAHYAGISQAEVEQVTMGPDADDWTPFERALLRMVDELHESATVSDEVWAELAAHYEVSQLVALPMHVGSFHQMCFLFNMLGVEPPDSTRGGLAARTPAARRTV